MDFIIFFFYCNSDWGLPDDSVGKESTCNAGDTDLIPVWGRSPGGGHGNPLQCSCPHGLRSLTGYSPKGCRVGQNWATKQAHTRNSDISQFCGIFDILNVLLWKKFQTFPEDPSRNSSMNNSVCCHTFTNILLRLNLFKIKTS